MGNSVCSMGKLMRPQLEKQRIWVGYPLCGLLEVLYWWLLKPTAVSKSRLYGKGCLDDEQGECQSVSVIHV